MTTQLSTLPKATLVTRATNSGRKAKQLGEWLGSPIRAAKSGGVVLGAAVAAGVVDAKVKKIPLGSGVKPSAGVGLVLFGVGIALGSPTAVEAATGALAPSAYEFGFKMAGGEEAKK